MDFLGDVGQIPLQYLSLIQDFLEDPCRFLGKSDDTGKLFHF